MGSLCLFCFCLASLGLAPLYLWFLIYARQFRFSGALAVWTALLVKFSLQSVTPVRILERPSPATHLKSIPSHLLAGLRFSSECLPLPDIAMYIYVFIYLSLTKTTVNSTRADL